MAISAYAVKLPIYDQSSAPEILSKKFFFIRHGQTDANKNNIIAGSTDYPLNYHGIRQVELAGKILRNTNISAIISSPLTRAKQTAEIIAKKLNVNIIYNENLRELYCGKFEQKIQNQESEHHYIRWINGEELAEGGMESRKKFDQRIIAGINESLEKYEQPLFVSHAAVFAALTQITKIGYKETNNAVVYEFIPVANDDGKKQFKLFKR